MKNWLCKTFAPVTIVVALATLSACNQTEAPAPTEAAAAPAVEAKPAPQVTFVNAALGTEVAADGGLANPLTQFGVSDAIKAVAVLEGDKGATANLKVEFLAADGQKIAETAKSVDVNGRTAVVLDVAAPQGGWKADSYVARFYLADVPNWEVAFKVN